MPGSRLTRFVRQAAALTVLLAAGLAAPARTAAAAEATETTEATQTPRPAATTLRIYLDCRVCDQDYLRQHVGFVEYVRDRNVADLHLLVLTETTGGGGRVWTLMFIGYDRLRGQNRTLEFSTPQSASADDQRREFARVFRLGLVGYAAGLSVMDDLDVTWLQPEAAVEAIRTDDDPWNHWVFRLDAGGDLSGERQTRFESYQYSLSTSRVTEDWKFNVSGGRHADRSRFEFEDEEPLESTRESWDAELLLVRSLGPRWSLGGRVRASRSSFSNIDRLTSVGAGLEFDAFPYRESSRRSLTLQYLAGIEQSRYREVTIFDVLEDNIPTHAVNLSAGFRQPWGSLNAQATYTQHLEHPERYRASVEGSTDVQLFSGFSVTLFGEYSRIHDQISLPRAGATRDDVLLRLQQLSTTYSYFVGVGVSYSFGSIFNSVVNPRFAR
jgi:hypothetical protein